MLLGAAATDAAKANAPGAHRLQPWRYTPSLAIAFDAAEAPVQYFSAGGWAGVAWWVGGWLGSGCGCRDG